MLLKPGSYCFPALNTAQVRESQPFDQGDQLLILRNGKRITTGRSYRKAVQEFLKRAT